MKVFKAAKLLGRLRQLPQPYSPTVDGQQAEEEQFSYYIDHNYWNLSNQQEAGSSPLYMYAVQQLGDHVTNKHLIHVQILMAGEGAHCIGGGLSPLTPLFTGLHNNEAESCLLSGCLTSNKQRCSLSIHSFIADIYIAPLQVGLLRNAPNPSAAE